MLNKVILIGRITREISLMRTNSNRDYTRFTLAVSRRTQNENQQNADFISCIAWNKTAVTMHDYLRKGSLIAIEGHLKTGRYEKNGETVFTTDVEVENFHFLESKNTEQTRFNENESGATNTYQNNETSENTFNEPQIDNEELPF